MAIDNDIYNRLADQWWTDNSFFSLLRTGLNRGRFGYFQSVLGQLRPEVRGLTALDIGCGGGLLAEEFARAGFRVTGVDPSEASLHVARAHARESGLEIDYRHASGEALPFPDGAFDIVYCCDVLEHVSDLDQVIAESARVLKPGGLYFYDTINRTWRSKLVVIKMLQEWSWTSAIPRDVHDWKMFIRPEELRSSMKRHGLELRGVTGLGPRAPKLLLARAMFDFKRGRLSHAELGRRLDVGESRDINESYMGYAERLREERQGEPS
jgi:2-polyprenyl-6-hydroxyphenyl methylase/3-demethylubiquinone-9 3-methyltransferase